MKKCIYLALLLTVTLLSGCGGGGGGGNGSHPTQAVVKLSTSGTGTIGIVQVRLTLPAGVTVKATNRVTDTGVVTASGNAGGAEIVYGIYSSPTMTVVIGKTSGFSPGEFATVNCDIASGSTPSESDFSVSNLDAWDVDGKSMAGLTAGFTADFQ